MKKKYYAVAKGNKVGIFQSWAECAASVKGYSGAKYRGFPDAHSAACWYFEELGRADEAKQAARKRSKKSPTVPDQAGAWRFIPASGTAEKLNPEELATTWGGRVKPKDRKNNAKGSAQK